MSTHTNSPDHTPIQPLHNPSLAAQVVVSQALIDNGEIASLAKKGNPTFNSPTDNLLTPCTRRLNANAAKRNKDFYKPHKTVLFESNDKELVSDPEQVAVPIEKKDDDENPFIVK